MSRCSIIKQQQSITLLKHRAANKQLNDTHSPPIYSNFKFSVLGTVKLLLTTFKMKYLQLATCNMCEYIYVC